MQYLPVQCSGSFTHLSMRSSEDFLVCPAGLEGVMPTATASCSCLSFDRYNQRYCLDSQVTAIVHRVNGGYSVVVLDNKAPWSAESEDRSRRYCDDIDHLLNQVVAKGLPKGARTSEDVVQALSKDLSNGSASLKHVKAVCGKLGRPMQVTAWEGPYGDEEPALRDLLNQYEGLLQSTRDRTGDLYVKAR